MARTATTRPLPTEIMLIITEHFYLATVSVPTAQRLCTARSVGYETASDAVQRVCNELENYLEAYPDMTEHIRNLIFYAVKNDTP